MREELKAKWWHNSHSKYDYSFSNINLAQHEKKVLKLFLSVESSTDLLVKMYMEICNMNVTTKIK